MPRTDGIHHVTAMAGDPKTNLGFYTDTVGLRLVKKSVNQDEFTVYHLFYGDREGSPGTSLTFFPYPDMRRGRAGAGQVTETSLIVPEGSVGFWTDRFDEAGVDYAEPVERFGDTVVPFTDPDGTRLELVARADAPDGPTTDTVPDDAAVRGFFGVTLTLGDAEATVELLREMGYEHDGENDEVVRYTSDGELGYVVDVREDDTRLGRGGAGTVHHVAFRAEDTDELEDWRDLLRDQGLHPTEVIDRKWFKSVYVRTPGGVLFEFATEGPGYTVDEDLDSLGESLVLPDWLEDRRDVIESGLPEL